MTAKKKPNEKLKRGRPNLYTRPLANKICALIADNRSLRTICKKPELPSMGTVLTWLRDKPDFLTQYARARSEQAEAIYEDIGDIEADLRAGVIDPNTARVLIDSHKWRAGKMRPKKYGERQIIEHAAGDNIMGLVATMINDRVGKK